MDPCLFYKVILTNVLYLLRRSIDNLLFYDPTVQRKIPPIPKYQALAMNNAGLDGSPEKDNTILVMNKKIEDLEVEVKYLKGKLKLYERENKVLRMAVKR